MSEILAEQLKSVDLYLMDSINDFRLFPGQVLYSEGRPKSYFRGKLHVFACLFIFPYFLYLYYDHVSKSTEPINTVALGICLFNLIVVYITHCFSSLFHAFNLTVEQEIIAQKLDIGSVSLYIATSIFPAAILFLPTTVCVTIIIISISLCCWNWYSMYHSNYSMLQPIFIVIAQNLFIYYIYNSLNVMEIIYLYGSIISLAIGTTFLACEICPKCFNQDIFSYYEIYHSFTILCLLGVCLLNYSIYKRYTENELSPVNEDLKLREHC